jgi:hypothetical protein
VKTLWNDHGQDVGDRLLQFHPGPVIQVPAIFPQFGWTSYTIHDIQAICQDVMNYVQCIPPPRIPGRRPVAPQLVVDNNGDLTCIKLVLDDIPNPPGIVYARTCFPVRVKGRAFATQLDLLIPGISIPGNIC